AHGAVDSEFPPSSPSPSSAGSRRGAPQGPGFGPQPGFGGPQQPFGMPGDQGAYPPPPPVTGGRASKPMIIGVGALVLVAAVTVGVVMWPGGEEGGTARPQASDPPSKQVNNSKSLEREQAEKVNSVLDASGDARRALVGGLAAARACKTLPQAITGFQQVAQRRQAQLRATQTLKVDKLPNGERLRLTLRQSFQASLDVDRALLAWAQRNRARCKGKPRPAAAQAPGRAQAERQATASKQRFVAMWNPIAGRNGLPKRPWSAI
ncbi:hypothetical protein ACSNOI_29785, partial [Actinomadura kijaniata]